MKNLKDCLINENKTYYMFVVFGTEEQGVTYAKDYKLVSYDNPGSIHDEYEWIEKKAAALKKKDGQDWKFSGYSNENGKEMKEFMKEFQTGKRHF